MKPIIFSTYSVMAIQEGRKTQTRRVVKPQPVDVPDGAYMDPYNHNYDSFTIWTKDNKMCLHCGGDRKNMAHWKAHYQPGQILWVRETWAPCATIDSWLDNENKYIYKADFHDQKVSWKWRSPRFMPKKAARLFLLVKSVSVEQLQDVNHDDALAEGIDIDEVYADYECGFPTAVMVFASLWDSLNAKRGYPWENNPWVWRIEFERTEDIQLFPWQGVYKL